jgi:hypothetical protein
MNTPSPSFDHLAQLSDEVGLFEHADGTQRRVEHGYCTDDNARLLVVACREPDPSPLVRELAARSLAFVIGAQVESGRFHNRLSADHRWTDEPSVGDWWGRALWGLGTAAAHSPVDALRREALVAFERAAGQRSPWPNAMTFAGLGAVEVLQAHPENRAARGLLVDLAAALPPAGRDPLWPWPDARLAYANAARPEVMIATGSALCSDELTRTGLDLLAWLLEHETRQGRLSVTPSGGRSLGDPRPAFDQQPIEVAALADACARAAVITGDPRWTRGVTDAIAWFLGANDANAVMRDPATGGGFDGLTPDGPNLNQGAESTLALVSTLQHARRLVAVA